jgi:DNA-binding transcriptional LysR family regulator
LTLTSALVAPALQRLADQHLVVAHAVEVAGVDQVTPASSAAWIVAMLSPRSDGPYMPDMPMAAQAEGRDAEFFTRYPDIRVKLNASDRFVDLIGEGVDCVVRVGILSDSTLIARSIGAMEQITCASKAYLDRHGRPRTLAELEQHTMINYFSSRTGRELPWEYMQNGELKTLKLRGQVSVASSEAYMACCLAGLGLVQAPLLGAEDLLAQGVIEEVLPEFKPPPLPVAIVYSHNRHDYSSASR